MHGVESEVPPEERSVVTWPEREEQWRRFAAWEADRLRTSPPDFRTAVAWFSEAWALARRLDPEWGSPARLEEHVRHIQQVRAALAHLGPHEPRG
jgi:hypothetical protein